MNSNFFMVGIHTRKKLGIGLIPILKTHSQNSDLVGFIPRPIPMKPRFDGFHGYEKMGFEYGSHTHNQNPNPVFFGCECMMVGIGLNLKSMS